jgi:hypothetical protein
MTASTLSSASPRGHRVRELVVAYRSLRDSDGHVVDVPAVALNNPPSKLADAELHFTDGVLDGLKLIGFAVWERRSGSGRNVTFPARQYSVNGERRSYALLRPVEDAASQERVRELVLEAYAAFEQEQTEAAS